MLTFIAISVKVWQTMGALPPPRRTTALQRAESRCPFLSYVSLLGPFPHKRCSLYKGQTRMLPNKDELCVRAEKAVEIERNLRDSLILKELKKKENVIVELTNRVHEWNNTNCPECFTSLKGKGPQILNEHEVKIYEKGNLPDDRSESAIRKQIRKALEQIRDIWQGDPFDEYPRQERDSFDLDGLQFPMDDI